MYQLSASLNDLKLHTHGNVFILILLGHSKTKCGSYALMPTPNFRTKMKRKMKIGQTFAKHTIQVLKNIFSLEGFSNTVVTDNDSQFTSSDFEAFCKQHGISHVTSTPC